MALRLALAGLRKRWGPSALFMAAAFCLCFAGAIHVNVQAEQALPCQLFASAAQGKRISDETLAKLRGIPGVTAATTVLEMPLTMTSGKYSAKLTLTGVDGGYLDGAFAQGRLFPPRSAMPYIVLNKAACRLFAGDDGKDGYDAGPEDNDGTDAHSKDARKLPPIDWLNAGFVLRMGEGERPVAACVCGILDDVGEDDPPAAYVSLPAAETLARRPGQALVFDTAWVRVENVGRAHEVFRSMAALGLTADDDNAAQQTRWDTLRGEMRYLLALAILALFSASALLHVGGRLALLKERPAWHMLKLMGAGTATVRHAALLQSLLVSLGGAAAGVLAALALPSFLPPDMGKTVFVLNMPAWVAAAAAAVCAMVGMASSFMLPRDVQ